jgi:hypothetical protein
LVLVLLTTVGLVSAAEPAAKYPPRLRRDQSFLGMHFDFHARPDDKEIGKNTTRAMIENVIRRVKPDYLQIDCKGHPGWSSYPTKVGAAVPGITGDPLRVWRQVTAEHGVSLFMHYSGVIDNEACNRHPDWAALPAGGKPGAKGLRATSLFGPYTDQLLIPQLCELGTEYGVDGVWVDGDCWGAMLDYSQPALDAFRKATGIQTVPRKPSDAHYQEFMDFNREAYRRYLRHWVDTVHQKCPQFQIASNWSFSDHMPEPVSANVDFLSGDYSLQNSVNSARFSGRCLALQGKPWDLMAWAFSGKTGGRSLKTVVQLEQEAAVVLAQGGGFQAYFTQKRDGAVRDYQMALMEAVAKFCRARQAVCHRAEAVPQIALLYSTAAHYRQCPRMFSPYSPGLTELRGILTCLIHGQHCVDIRSEHHLKGHMAQYPLIVVPDWDYLDPAFRAELLEYVRGGGQLLLAGPQAAGLFAKELKVEPQGQPAAVGGFLEHDGWLANIGMKQQKVRLGAGVKPFGKIYAQDDRSGPTEVAATITSLGKGRMAAVWFAMGERYTTAQTTVARDWLSSLVRELMPRPLVEVRGSHLVEVVVRRSHGSLAVNLLNGAGPHANPAVYTFDEVPPVGPLTVTVRAAQKPREVRLEPTGKALPFRYEQGAVTTVVPKLELHEVVVLK